jgi:hypothetical protein
MHVRILVVIRIMTQAKLVAGSFHVFYGMDEMVLLESAETAEYSRFVYRLYLVFQLHEAQRTTCFRESYGDQYPVRRSLDSVLPEEL